MQSRPITLWRRPDFMKLWVGETVSFFGTQITVLALPLTAVLSLSASPAQMGVLNALALAPFLILTLFAGVWIDRLRRRPILIITNVARAVLLGLVPLLMAIGQLRIEHLYVITFLIGSCTVFFQLAYQAYLPTLIAQNQLVQGNSLLSISESSAQVGGPGVGGVLVDLVRAPFALLLDAFSFLFSAVCVALIRKPEPPAESRPARSSLTLEIREGLHLMLTNRYLRAFAGEAATYNLFLEIITVVLILYAVRDLGMRPSAIGLVFSIGSVGALIGALLTGRAARRLGVGATIVGAAILADIAPLLLLFAAGPMSGPASGPTLTTLAILGASFFLQGVGLTGCNIHVVSVRQVIIPTSMLGRVNASYRLIVSGIAPLGSLLGGLLGEQIGIRPTIIIGVVGLLTTWLWLWFSPVPQLRQIADAEALQHGDPIPARESP